MNKLLPVIVVILLVLVGGGIYLSNQSKKQKPSTDNNTNVTKTEENKGGVFTSIKDALTKSLSLECTYKDETGVEKKTYMKAGAVRVDAKPAENDKEAYSQVIFKDSKMYSWNPITKQGIVFTVPENVTKDITPAQATAPAKESSEENKEESFLAQIEKYKDACKPATVSDRFLRFRPMSSSKT